MYTRIISLLLLLTFIGTVMAELPPDPANIQHTSGCYWVNHTWEVGSGTGAGDWYLVTGESFGQFDGYKWAGTAWQADTPIGSGLGDVGSRSLPDAFEMDGTQYLIAGRGDGLFSSYNWTGTTWQTDNAMKGGLVDTGTHSAPETFERDGTWYLITGRNDGNFGGYNWTGTTWQADTVVDSGLSDAGGRSVPEVFEMDGTWYLIAGREDGNFDGYNWTGTTWQVDTAIDNGLGDVGWYASPRAFEKDGTWYLITGKTDGNFNGYNWTGTTWQADTDITGGLSSAGAESKPTVFSVSPPANVTDSYNVSVNGVWYNGTTDTHYMDTYAPEEWQNITVWAYNNTAPGTLSMGSISQNTQAPPDPTAGLQPDSYIRLDPHPDQMSFYTNSTYIVCNFTNRQPANVTIKFEKYNTTDNSSDTIHDYGEFVSDRMGEFNILNTYFSTVGWYRASMYDIDGNILCYYEVVVRSHTGTNYETLHGSVRFSDADGVPSVSFVENIAGRAQTWTTDSTSLTHSISLLEYDSDWMMDVGGNYTNVDHINTSADATQWVLSMTYTVDKYYRMILYSHDGEVLDTHCVKAVIPESNVIEVRAQDVQTGVQIPTFVATVGSNTKTSTDGVAYFYNITNGAHIVTVTADNYKDAQVTVYMANSYINATVYMLTYSPYAPPHHDVEFILTSVVGTRYVGVNVSVSYPTGNGDTAYMSGITDSMGSVTFSMVATVRYTVTFVDAAQGINKTVSLYPKDSRYYIIASSGGWSGLDNDHSPVKEITTDATYRVINATHAYIDVTYTDALNDTSVVTVYINQTNPNNPRSENVIASQSGTSANVTFVFIVTDYKGKDYKIHIVATHGEFGTVERYHGIRMPGMLIDLNFPPFAYLLMSLVIILFVAGMFSQTNPEMGGIVCCAIGWIFLAFGWLSPLGVFAPLSITLASVYAVAVNISARHRRGGYI